jgi:DNA-binding response OmpR family regulator
MANHDAHGPASGAKKLRVLVVEDDPATLAATVEMLQLLGHWATGVQSAEMAKDRFFENAFDVVMIDIGLPALSGLDLAESLRERFRVEIIFATGMRKPETPVPAAAWLQKPFSVDQLEAALAECGDRLSASA